MVEYSKLPAHQQRAIDNEINLIIQAKQLSKTFGRQYSDQSLCKREAEDLRKSFSNNPEKIKDLVEKDSNEIFLYPLLKDRIQHRKEVIKEKAEIYDRTYLPMRDMRSKGR
jgi:hypothetical protein